MEYGAIDLDSKESVIRIVQAAGDRVLHRRVLEALGHEVMVADPNYAPMYGKRSRRIKTEKRDVAGLTRSTAAGSIDRGIGSRRRSER